MPHPKPRESPEVILMRGVHRNEVHAFNAAPLIARALAKRGVSVKVADFPFKSTLHASLSGRGHGAYNYFFGKADGFRSELLQQDPNAFVVDLHNWDEDHFVQLWKRNWRKPADMAVGYSHHFPQKKPRSWPEIHPPEILAIKQGKRGVLLELPAVFQLMPRAVRRRLRAAHREVEEILGEYRTCHYVKDAVNVRLTRERGLAGPEVIEKIAQWIQAQANTRKHNPHYDP